MFESLCDLRLNQCTSTPPQRTPRRGAYFVRVLRLPKLLGELDTDLIVFDGEVAVDLLAFKRVRQLGAHGAIGIIEVCEMRALVMRVFSPEDALLVSSARWFVFT